MHPLLVFHGGYKRSFTVLCNLTLLLPDKNSVDMEISLKPSVMLSSKTVLKAHKITRIVIAFILASVFLQYFK